jgi:hypothetical protein
MTDTTARGAGPAERALTVAWAINVAGLSAILLQSTLIP